LATPESFAPGVRHLNWRSRVHKGKNNMKNLILISFCLVIGTVTVRGQIPNQKDSLSGVHQLKVLIYTSNEELRKVDLNRDILQTDIELRLRKARVPVLAPDAAWPKDYQPAALVVSVSVAQDGDGVCAVAIRVSLWRTIGSEVIICTWENIGVGLFGKSTVRQGVRDGIGEHVDHFANSYLETHSQSKKD